MSIRAVTLTVLLMTFQSGSLGRQQRERTRTLVRDEHVTARATRGHVRQDVRTRTGHADVSERLQRCQRASYLPAGDCHIPCHAEMT